MRSAKGSVARTPDGTWRVRIEEGRDPRTGKRARASRNVRGSRKRAEQVKAAMLVEAGESGEARESMTLQGLWEDLYLPHCERTLRPTTVHGYEGHYANLVQGAFGGVLLSRIRPAAVRSWLDSLGTDGRRLQGFKMLRQMLNFAVRSDLLESNPCDRVEPPKRPRARRFRVLDAQDVQVYLWHYEHTPLGPLVFCVLGAGLTRSEAVALDWEDIADGVVDIDDAVTSVGGRAHDDDPKNGFRVRRVALPDKIAERLERMRSTGPICKDSNGNRMNPETVTKTYRKLQEGLPENCLRVPLKDLRHTSLTLALEAGTELLDVSRRAGHADPSTTARFYLRPHDEEHRQSARNMDALL